MRIISKKTETQFVPVPVSTEGAKILLTKSIYKKDGTGTYAYLTDQYTLHNGLTLWIRGELLHYDTVEVFEEEDREPTLEELAELYIIATNVTYTPVASTRDYIQELREKYPDFSFDALYKARNALIKSKSRP